MFVDEANDRDREAIPALRLHLFLHAFLRDAWREFGFSCEDTAPPAKFSGIGFKQLLPAAMIRYKMN